MTPDIVHRSFSEGGRANDGRRPNDSEANDDTAE